jgi:hypothetical protein
MTRKKRKNQIIGEPRGAGEVYRADTWLAHVGYSLVVKQTILTKPGGPVVPGPKDITGEITVLEGERDLIANQQGQLMLHLEDGRKLAFLILQQDPTSATYEITNATGEGLTEN